MKKLLRHLLCLGALILTLLGLSLSSGALAAQAAGPNPVSYSLQTAYAISDQISNSAPSGDRYGSLSNVLTVVNPNGTVTVCGTPQSASDANIYIHEFNRSGVCTKTLMIARELSYFACFTKDSSGNYYVFYAKDILEETEKSVKNMAIVKYNTNGTKTGTLLLNGDLAGDSSDSYLGVKKPINASGCRMEISGTTLMLYFGREMYKHTDNLNHQASYAIYVNTADMKKSTVHTSLPYASHSFDQFILPVSNGFVTVDRGDAYPRGFMVSLVPKSSSVTSKSPFLFKDTTGSLSYNYTFSGLGGIDETASGYLLCGTYEDGGVTASMLGNCRKIFVQTYSSNLQTAGTPIYLTNYTNPATEHATSVRMIKAGTGRHVILWELREANGTYRGSYMMIVNDSGGVVKAATSLGNIRLNANDVLRYNATTGRIYWSVGLGSNIAVYELDPTADVQIPTATATVSVLSSGGAAISGATVKSVESGKVFTASGSKYSASLPLGQQTIEVSCPGYASATSRIQVFQNSQLSVTLLGAYVNVAVWDAAGNPLSGATVTIEGDGTVLTGSGGYYSTREKPSGTYTLRVWKSGYISTTITLQNCDLVTSSYRVVRLSSTASKLTVIAQTPSGQSISDFTVSLDSGTAQSSSGGSVVYPSCTAGNHTISLTAPGFKDYSGTFLMKDPNQQLIIKMSLSATGTAVTGVTLSPTAKTVSLGGTFNLTSTVSPANASNKKVTWSSNKTSVATVDQNGKVTAKGAGKATITVKTDDGGKTANCVVTVTSTAHIPVKSLSVSGSPGNMIVKKTATLKATVSPSNATDKTVTWKSSDTKVATVGKTSGVVTAKGAGTVKITATAGDKSKTVTITVHSYVILRINKITAVQNGIVTTIDSQGTKPIIVSGKTMVPIRFIAEKMGGKVSYQSDTTPIVMTYGNRRVELKLNSKSMKVTVDGKTSTVTLDVAAQKIGGRTFIPLRAIGQALGFTIYYDAATEIIVVNNPGMSAAIRNERIAEGKKVIKK